MKHIFIFSILLWFGACVSSGNVQPEAEPATEPAAAATTVKSIPKEAPINPFDTLPGAQPQDFSLDYLMGKFDPSKHPDFVPVDKRYSDGDPYFLRKDTYESFKRMWAAANSEGIELKIISATRPFNRQKSIWEAKWTGARKIENGANASSKYPDPETRAYKILEYSSMPGTSRHHWGTDIDIHALTNAVFEQGQGKKIYDWLIVNADRFGFCQPYTPKGEQRPFGYNEEKWHWSYIPVARQLTDMAHAKLKDDMIAGFKGAGVAVDIGVVEKYVLGINTACRIKNDE